MAESLSEHSLNKLRNEVIMAEKLNDDKLKPSMLEGIRRYTGTHVPSIARDWDIIVNEFYPIIQYHLPAIFFRNPRAFLKPRNKNFIIKKRDPITGQMTETFGDSSKSAKTQEAILNYSITEIRYKEEVRKVLMDALIFRHGVLWHGYKGNFGMTDEQSMFIKDSSVFVKRLSPMRFLFDPAVCISDLEEARWIGRSFDVPLEDLIEDKTLDVDKKELKGQMGYATKTSEPISGGGDAKTFGSVAKTLLDETDPEYRNSTASKFVRVYEILQRPSLKERNDGEKGKIILFTKEQRKPLRVSKWPYKAEGWPVKILMFNYVPEEHFGMADIDIYSQIIDQKNMVINLQLRNAQQNSKVWVGISKEGLNEEDLDKIKVGDQTIIGFEGNPRDKMVVASAGSVGSSELYLIDTRIQGNLDSVSGVNDLKKGFLRSGEESATSVKIRNAGVSSRSAYRQDLMADFLKESLHFLNQLLKQFYPIDKVVRIVGSLDIEWSDNPSYEEVQADTDVEIDVISMLPEDPQTEIAQLNTVLQLMIGAINDPAVFQKLTQEGKTFELAPIIENILMRLKIRNPDVFRNIRPEESEGFVAVKDMREASANVQSALSGQEPPFPPAEGQDHRARLEVYGNIRSLIGEMGESVASQIIDQLIMTAQALMTEEEQKESPRTNSPLKPIMPSVQNIGAA